MKAGTLEIEIMTNLMRLQSEMAQIRQAVGTGMNDVGRYTQAANDNLVRLAKSSENVATRVNAMTGVISSATRRSQADFDAYGAELDKVRARYNPVFAVVQQYRQSLEDVRRAHAVGAISADEMAAAIGRERQAALASIAAAKGRSSAIAEAAKMTAQAEREGAAAAALAAREEAHLAAQAALLRAQLDPMYAAQQRFNQAMDQADDLYRAGAITLREYAAAQQLARDSLQQHAQSVAGSVAPVAKLGTALKFNGIEALNFSRQMADVGVTAAMGMNPLMIVLQQGPQLFDILQTKAVATGTTIGVVARAAGAQIWAAVAPLLPIFAAVAAVAATIAVGFALGAREINKSNGDIAKGMGLTEKQLERVKKAGVDTAVTMGDTFFAFFDVVGDRLGKAFDGPLKFLKSAWNDALDFIVSYGNAAIKFLVGGFVGGVRGIAATWQLLPTAIADALATVSNKAIEGIEWIIQKSLEGINWLIGQTNAILGTSFGKFDETIALGRNKISGAGADFSKAFGAAFMSGITDTGAAIDAFWSDVAKKARARREEAIRKAGGAADAGAKGGKSQGELFADMVGDISRDIAMIEAQTKALELSEDAALLMTNQQKLLNDAQAKGITLTDRQRAVLLGLAGDMTIAQIALKSGEWIKDANAGLDRQIRGFQQAASQADTYGQSLYSLIALQDLMNDYTDKGIKLTDEQKNALAEKALALGAAMATGDSAKFMADFTRESAAATAAMTAEREAIGLTGAALEAYRFEQDALADARTKNIKLSPEELAKIKAMAAEYGAARQETNDLLSAQDKLVERFSSVADAANDAANTMSSAFGSVGGAIGDVIAILAEYGAKQEEIKARLASRTIDQAQAERELGNAQLNSIGSVLGAAKGLFKEHSAGYKAMAAAEKAFAVVQLANTAINIAAGAAKMFASLGPFGFPAVAAMVAVMAGLGASVSGGRSYKPPTAEEMQAAQGAGSVLGDAEAKSSSIAAALALMAKNADKDLEYSNEMVRSLRAIESNIGALTGLLARQLGLSADGAFDTSGLGLGSKTSVGLAGKALFGIPGLLGVVDDIPVIGGLLNGIAKALFGTRKTVTLLDQGISFASQTVEDIINGGSVGQIYQDVQTQTKKKFLGLTTSNKTKVTTSYGDLDNDMERQVALIIGALKAGVLDAAGVLGVSGAEAALNAFQVELGKVSLKDLKGDEIREALEGVFSKLGDDMAAAVLSGLEAFQQVGEGMFETLARLARDYMTIDTALSSIGMTFGAVGLASVEARESLVDLFGGLDAFAEQTAFFRDNFLTETERMAPIIAAVNAEMARLGQTGVATNDQFKSLVLGLDLSSAAGADMYASLMAVAPAFAKVNEYLATLNETVGETGQTPEQIKATADQARQLAIAIADLENPELARQMRLADERAGIEDVNLAEFDRLQLLRTETERQAELAAQQKATADQAREIALAIADLENPELARQMRLADERALVEDANVAAFDRLQLLKDEAAAAELLNAKNKAIADENLGLENQWLQLIGDQAEIRRRTLAGLQSDEARAWQQQIWDYTDAQARAAEAQAAATAAAEAAAQVEADRLRQIEDARNAVSQAYERESSALQGTIDRMRDFAATIRALGDDVNAANDPFVGMALAQSRFAETSRLAQFGDEAALGRFSGDAKAYVEAARQFGSLQQYQDAMVSVLGGSNRAIGAADGLASAAERELRAMEAAVAGILDLNDKAVTFEDAMRDFTALQERELPVIADTVATSFDAVGARIERAISETGEKADSNRKIENADIYDLLDQLLRRLQAVTTADSVRVGNDQVDPLYTKDAAA
jgi:hypothetical protein